MWLFVASKCDELEARLLELRATVLDAPSHHTASNANQQGQVGTASNTYFPKHSLGFHQSTSPVVTIEDVLRWAEQPT